MEALDATKASTIQQYIIHTQHMTVYISQLEHMICYCIDTYSFILNKTLLFFLTNNINP